MTRNEWKATRRIMRGHVGQAWKAYQESAAVEFIASEKTLALYGRYWNRLQAAARLLQCNVKQATEILNIGGIEK